MATLNRPTLMKAHALLAAFILPVAMMFFITGAFYTWGIKGEYDTIVHQIKLDQPLQKKLSALVSLAETELTKRNIAVPSGQAKIKQIGDAFKLEWTGSNRDVVIEPGSQPLTAQLQIKNTSGYRQLVQLHKAKGGTPFKVYAAVLSTALMLLLFTGFIMAWQMPKLRQLTLTSTVLGIAVFIAMLTAS